MVWVRFLLFLGFAGATLAHGQSPAEERLENSPRHHEWARVAVPADAGEDAVDVFVAYPERAEPTRAVLVIHENRGLTDWVRAVADRLAEEGFLALAPDLLTGEAPGGGRTADFPSSDAARTAIYALAPAAVEARLAAVRAYARGLPASNGELAVVGFCWGGSQVWRVALADPDLVVACPFYGTAPAPAEADFAALGCAVEGFYGGSDARVNATLADTAAAVEAAGKRFVPVIYPDAGHAYMRRGEEAPPGDPNAVAMEASWERLLGLLRAE